MKKFIYIIAALMVCSQIAYAQGFDPTVEVSRTYESTLKLTPKPVPAMAVPDSLLRFDLDFDYSVFDKPYQGTGDYKPYLLDLRPQPDAYRGKKLYLKAGLGYTLHPELDLVFSPEVGNSSDLNIYAQHRSYFGKYKFSDAVNFSGYDSYSKVGVNGKTKLSSVNLSYNANYLGLLTKDGRYQDAIKTSFNAFEAMVGVANAEPAEIFYSAAVRTMLAGDSYTNYQDDNLGIFKIGFDGTIGKSFEDYVLAADVHFERTSFSFIDKANIGNWYIAPRYIAESNGFRLNLGVKLGSVMGSDHSWFDAFAPMKIHKSQVIYPDLHIAYELDPGKMDFFADVTGGDDLIGYEEIRQRDHFALPPFTDNSLVHFDIDAGLRGNINTVFRYDFALGFKSVGSSSVYAMNFMYAARKVYEDVSVPYLRGSVVYDCKPLLLEGRIMYRGTSFSKNANELFGEYTGWQVYSPRKLTVDLQAMYFWKSRIRGGVTARIGSGIKGMIPDALSANINATVLPEAGFDSFVDLGLVGEYSVDRTVSIYANVCNLLNKKYINDVMMPVSGLFVTAGLKINL
ncbi:MAG: hypothetical protein IJ151_08925 [Bacteroidales bacterium]|nr:hypothetical protein [Bacteroidales bacterium]